MAIYVFRVVWQKETSKNTSTWNTLSAGIQTQQLVANPKVNFGQMQRRVLPGSHDNDSNTLGNLENIKLTKPKAATQPETIPSGGKQKRKIWAKLKSGLFGWKIESKQRVQKTSATLAKHTYKAASVKTVEKVQEEKKHTHFVKNRPLTAVVGEGGGENICQIKMAESELSFSENRHTFYNNKIERENCHSALNLPGLESVDLTKMMDS